MQHIKLNTVSFLFYKRNKELVPRALFSYISTREFLRTREKCGEARAYVTQQCTRRI